MIGKEDVVSWFQKLESYRRIEIMCTLLNICVPFELRFLGTCLEELGRKDAQELRFFELRVNNPLEFGLDIAACRAGEPTDKKVRRKMALYLALIRTSMNRTSVMELFKTLESWGERDFENFADGDPLQELLLVYIMAWNHPVFSIEERTKCGDIFSKIISSKPTLQTDDLCVSQLSPQLQTQQQPMAASTMQTMIQQQQSSSSPLSHLQSPQQSMQPIPIPLLAPPMPHTFNPGPIPQYNSMGLIEASLAPQMTVEGLNPLQIPTIPDFTTMPPTWIRPNYPTYSMDANFPPQTGSPMLSQPSSPSNSRTGSPTRVSSNPSTIQQTTGLRNSQPRSIRTSRRPSTETTPPPQSQHQQLVGMQTEMLMQQQSAKFDEMLNVDGTAMSQLHQLKNGYTRPAHHTINRQTNKQSYSHMQHYQNQQQQQQQINNFAATATTQGLTYAMQNMNMGVDMSGIGTSSGGGAVNSQKSGGSDSGGSSIGSTGDISPPETPVTSMPAPTPMALRARLNLGRLTNRTPNLDKSGTSVIYAPPQSTSPHQLQQSSNDMPPMMTGVTSNLTYSLSNNHLQSPSHVTQATGGNILTTNQQQQSQMMLQQNPQQYAYHTQQQQTANAARLTTTMPPPITTNYRPQHQNVSGTTAFPQMQPNGDQIYSYPPHLTALPTPGGVITFLPTNPPPSLPPSVLRASPSNTAQSAQQLPAGLMQPPPPTAQTGVQSTTVASPLLMYPMLAVAGTNKLSCFNCGSTQHAGTNCPEASMEDVTRIVYKLDYNINHIGNMPPPPQQQQQQQQQQHQPPPPTQQILLQTASSSDQQSLPVPSPTNTHTSTASTAVGMPRTMSSLSLKSSDNKPVIMDEIVDLTNLSSSSNNSSTTSLNNVGTGGHK